MTEKVTISGWSRKTTVGTNVWVGLHGDAVIWKFTDAEGAETTLGMSHDAMRAMVALADHVMPKIPEASYKLLVEFVGKAAQMLGETAADVWKVAPEATPDSASEKQ